MSLLSSTAKIVVALAIDFAKKTGNDLSKSQDGSIFPQQAAAEMKLAKIRNKLSSASPTQLNAMLETITINMGERYKNSSDDVKAMIKLLSGTFTSVKEQSNQLHSSQVLLEKEYNEVVKKTHEVNQSLLRKLASGQLSENEIKQTYSQLEKEYSAFEKKVSQCEKEYNSVVSKLDALSEQVGVSKTVTVVKQAGAAPLPPQLL